MTKQQKAVERWNARLPVGTSVVRHRLFNPLREPQATQTRSAAWILGGHSPVVMVDGIAGAVALKSVCVVQ